MAGDGPRRGTVRRFDLRWRLCAAPILLFATAAAAAPSVTRVGPHVEGDALSFYLHDLEGRVVDSSDERFRGKVVFVDVFGTWCSPCISAIPTLKDLHARYSGDGLVIVAIAFEHGDDAGERRGFLRYFTESYAIPYMVLDGGSLGAFSTVLSGIKNVRGFPIEVLIDRDGKVVETRNGYGNKDRWSREIEAKLVDLLAKPATTAASPAATGPPTAE